MKTYSDYLEDRLFAEEKKMIKIQFETKFGGEAPEKICCIFQAQNTIFVRFLQLSFGKQHRETSGLDHFHRVFSGSTKC